MIPTRNDENLSTNWSKTTRYIVGVGLALLACFILYLSRSVISLLIIAALIAVIVHPIIYWLHNSARLPRGVAVALTYLGVLILVPLGLLLAIPAIVEALRYVLSLNYQSILQGGTEWLRSTLNAIKALPLPAGGVDTYIDQTVDAILLELGRGTVAEPIDLPSVETIIRSLSTALATTFRTAAGVVGTVFSQVTLVVFIFLTSLYISLSGHTFFDAFIKTVPARFRPEITVLIIRVAQLWNAFFRGQLTLMLLIGLISFIGLTILGIPGAIYLGIVAGLLELLPNLGPIIAIIPAVLVALLQGSSYLPVSPGVLALLVILFYVMVQQLENNLIVPRVLGEAVDLPALVVITGVVVGIEIGGLLGALLATPIIATIREIMRYAYHKILGENPFPPGQTKETKPAVGLSVQMREWLQKGMARFRKPAPPVTLPEPAQTTTDGEPGAKVYTTEE